jgi:hypothetical protein
MLDWSGLQAAGISTVMRGIRWPLVSPARDHAADSGEGARGGRCDRGGAGFRSRGFQDVGERGKP